MVGSGRASEQETRPSMVQLRRSSSEGAVATQDAVYQTADDGNAVTWAIVVAAAVIDPSRAIAAVSGNVATAGTNPRMSARAMSAYCVSCRMSAAWMVGSERTGRRRHATERDRSSQSDEGFMKHFDFSYGSNKKLVQRILLLCACAMATPNPAKGC